LRQRWQPLQIIEVRNISISSISAVLCCTDGYAPMIFFFEPYAILFDLRGTAKYRNFAHVRGHRRQGHKPLTFGGSQVYRLVHDHQTPYIAMAELVELQGGKPQNVHPYSRAPAPCDNR
jgi:hypothetical protein